MEGATAEDDPPSLIRSFTLPLSRLHCVALRARCVSMPAYLPSTPVFPPFGKSNAMQNAAQAYRTIWMCEEYVEPMRNDR